MLFAVPEDSGNQKPLTPEEINERVKRQFLDMLSRIEQTADPAAAIRAFKQLLRIRAGIEKVHYETILLQLCRLLNRQKRYGETLYFYIAAPYYLDSMMNASRLIAAANLKDTAFTHVLKILASHKQRTNVLLYNSNAGRIQNLKSTITTACYQNVTVFTDHYDLLNQDQEFINNYHLLIVVNNYNSQSMDVIEKFKKKFVGGLTMVLHCYSLEEARRIFHLVENSVNYVTYNDKMIYGMVHLALRQVRSQ